MKTNSTPDISIIIPILNEEQQIGILLKHLQEAQSKHYLLETIVVDGGSTDESVNIAQQFSATIVHSKKGRAIQMNSGAKEAKGRILYFLHADTFPPKNFDEYIIQSVNKNKLAGCFRLKFDTHHPLLQFFASLTRINSKICRGGDQSLFITKKLFSNLNGFNPNYIIYEDSEFIGRIYQENHFSVLPYHVITSARKYRKIGFFKLQYHFGMIHLKNYLGASPESLHQYYLKHIS